MGPLSREAPGYPGGSVCLGMRFAALGTTIWTPPPCVRGAPLLGSSGTSEGEATGAPAPGCDGADGRGIVGAKNRCNPSSRWVKSTAGVVAEDQGRSSWERPSNNPPAASRAPP
jgi:hypothetical protein